MTLSLILWAIALVAAFWLAQRYVKAPNTNRALNLVLAVFVVLWVLQVVHLWGVHVFPTIPLPW